LNVPELEVAFHAHDAGAITLDGQVRA